MLVVVSPLFIAIAVTVWASSGKPIFFRRRRYGYNRVPFDILKFRTLENDARGFYCTLLGAFLRRSCLDELPQLWNVVKGEMSLVGPRPLDAHESDSLSKYYPEHDERYQVRPGMTGLAQVRGMRGTLTRKHVETRLKLDGEYVRNRSFLIDLGILVETPFSLLRGSVGDYVPRPTKLFGEISTEVETVHF